MPRSFRCGHALGFAVTILTAFPAWAFGPPRRGGSAPPGDGVALARSGDCVRAVPLLERAELSRHRPATASALAGCHVSLGELVLAFEIYSGLAAEAPGADWTREDAAAQAGAAKSAAELDARLPRLTLRVTPADADYSVRVAGRDLGKRRGAFVVPPDEKVEVEISAVGFGPQTRTILLPEQGRETLDIRLERTGPAPPPVEEKTPEVPASTTPSHFVGARFRGYIVPTFLMNIVGDGGTTTYLPGGELTYTARLAAVDLIVGLGVTSYGLPATPFKPSGTPDTEWEIVESDLVATTLTLDVLYRLVLDDASRVTLKLGGGVGVGWAFAGELYRWQAYPANGQPDDPSAYAKCNGPNDPAGTYRYCNQLDKDADRYGAPDQVWGDGGARPVVYPWLALPEIGFAFRPDDRVEIDVDLGLSLQGILTGAGVRFGLD